MPVNARSMRSRQSHHVALTDWLDSYGAARSRTAPHLATRRGVASHRHELPWCDLRLSPRSRSRHGRATRRGWRLISLAQPDYQGFEQSGVSIFALRGLCWLRRLLCNRRLSSWRVHLGFRLCSHRLRHGAGLNHRKRALSRRTLRQGGRLQRCVHGHIDHRLGRGLEFVRHMRMSFAQAWRRFGGCRRDGRRRGHRRVQCWRIQWSGYQCG
ncbi:MAG: hypothetical protein RLZZ618_563 [Pseudomonadota bacterium]|jgi:hypothetical protein